jgi:hypothetical protein
MNVDFPYVPVSWGEIIDKITILELKILNIDKPLARVNIELELYYLNDIVKNSLPFNDSVLEYRSKLSSINKELWEVEDSIRECEANKDFGPIFINLARSVYRLNDQRSFLKKCINQETGSKIKEEKSYKLY